MHINNLALVIHSVEILNYRLIICNLLVIIPGVVTLKYRLLPHNLLVIKPQRSDLELYIANL